MLGGAVRYGKIGVIEVARATDKEGRGVEIAIGVTVIVLMFVMCMGDTKDHQEHVEKYKAAGQSNHPLVKAENAQSGCMTVLYWIVFAVVAIGILNGLALGG